MSKASITSIVDAVGSDAIEQALSVSSHSVRYARFTGKFPSSWFPKVRDLCAEHQIECPEDLFNWRGEPKPSEVRA